MKYTITVKPGTSQEKIIKTNEDELIVYLHVKPIGGEANKALIKTLSEYFDTPKTSIKIISGAKSRKKVIEF
jgi:uncharacterized protein (TIGR00251 family)